MHKARVWCPGQGTRSHMPHVKIPHAAMKMQDSTPQLRSSAAKQINVYIFKATNVSISGPSFLPAVAGCLLWTGQVHSGTPVLPSPSHSRIVQLCYFRWASGLCEWFRLGPFSQAALASSALGRVGRMGAKWETRLHQACFSHRLCNLGSIVPEDNPRRRPSYCSLLRLLVEWVSTFPNPALANPPLLLGFKFHFQTGFTEK